MNKKILKLKIFNAKIIKKNWVMAIMVRNIQSGVNNFSFFLFIVVITLNERIYSETNIIVNLFPYLLAFSRYRHPSCTNLTSKGSTPLKGKRLAEGLSYRNLKIHLIARF